MDNVLQDNTSWRGCSMNEIYRNLNEWELKQVPEVFPSESHTVLYKFPIQNSNEPPRPFRGYHKWDSFYVRLPFSSKSQYPVTQLDGSVCIESRWELIQKALLRPINNSRELENAILSYNSKYDKLWKFRSLHKLFDEDLSEEESDLFFSDLLPKIIRLALRLPELITTGIPLLKQGQNRSISLTQEQVASLLANAFLCTYPRRNTMKRKSEYSTFPDINFNRLFQTTGQQIIEKIKCICHYFRRVCNNVPIGVITFTRRSFSDVELPNWDECNAPLGRTPLHITSIGTIEDQGNGLLQVDFANKFLGGGVLGSGCVQEEIRFVICPELIVSKLFTEALKPSEALLMTGCERYSKYTGYASTFTWDGNYIDEHTPFDESRRRQCSIVAIDALYFVNAKDQYREKYMLRELNKAYIGFYHSLSTPASGVASGNWGCGAFGGEATLKALLQLMACTITKRPLVYFTFGNQELRDAIHRMHTFFIENNITVKQLWSYLKQYQTNKLLPENLYSFICQIHSDRQKTTPSTSSHWTTRNQLPIENQISKNKFKSKKEFESIEELVNSVLDDDSPARETSSTLTKSPDIFATSSSSSPEILENYLMINDNQKDCQQQKELLANKETNVKVKTRQRSLLEMPYIFYCKGSPSKRHCIKEPPHGTSIQKNGFE